ncbi:MAG: hypothetical protein HZC36_05565 [Armatimonadetes bacterium]|nr:hypothetical protein [Armatimonadota bacterium]
MPIVITFHLKGAGPATRNRMQCFFERLGWQNLGGSAFRYPKLADQRQNPMEDWFNHVIPALMLLRSAVLNQNLQMTKFTIDVQSSTGFELGAHGSPPMSVGAEDLFRPSTIEFGEQKLVDWINGIGYPYAPDITRASADPESTKRGPS